MSKSGKWAIAAVSACVLAAIAVISISSYRAGVKAEEQERIRLEEEAALAARLEEYQSFLEANDAFFPGSFFNSNDISGKKKADVFSAYESEVNEKVVNLTFSDEREAVSVKGSDLNLDFTGFEKYISDEYDNAEFSFDEYYGTAIPKNYEFNVYDDVSSGMIERNGIDDLVNASVTASHNAYVYVDGETGEIKEEPEVSGGEISSEKIAEKIKKAFSEGSDAVSFDESDYIIPEISIGSAELEKQKTLLESKKNKTVKISLCGEETVLKEKELWKLLSTYDGVVDEKALSEYVGKLKNRFDSYYFRRPFVTSSGKEINLETGNYGWVIDKNGTMAAIRSAIEADEDETSAQACYSVKGQRPAHSEIGNTYIEVSIHYQKIWVYVNGECVLDDDVTTGELTTGNPHTVTNCGVFKLSYKTKDVTLRGADYEEPVSYWMPFDGGIGFHDATWREDWEFGGENYLGNGSHGCVNMRLGSAGILYNIIDYEIPIIVW